MAKLDKTPEVLSDPKEIWEALNRAHLILDTYAAEKAAVELQSLRMQVINANQELEEVREKIQALCRLVNPPPSE